MIASRVAGRLRVARVHEQDGTLSPELLTNIGGGEPRPKLRPGSVLLAAASVLLLLLAAAQGYVSWRAQYGFVLSVKHAALPSGLEALGLDAGAVVFALIALARARLGHSAVIERVLNLACAAGSLTMNLLAADLGSPRAIAVYVMPSLLYIAGSDRLIAVARHQALGADEASGSSWRFAGAVALYALRLVLAPLETPRGLRLWVLDSTPLPGVTASATPALEAPVTATVTAAITDVGEHAARPSGQETKKSRLLALYADHPLRGDRGKVSRVASELAEAAGLQAGTARTYLYQELDREAVA
jgi:hypothetical protein